TRTESGDLAFLLECSHGVPHFRALELRQRQAVKLREIEALDAEALERVLGVLANGLRLEVGGPTGSRKPAELRGDEEFLSRRLFKDPAKASLAAASTVHISGVEERAPRCDGGSQHIKGIGIGHIAPLITADLPAAQPDLGHRNATEHASLHGNLVTTDR